MTTVHDVAAYVTRHFPRGISTMKLQKLCYIAQGWSLALLGRPMFPEEFEAWKNGPVCYELFDRHRGEYSIDAWNGNPENLAAEERAVLDGVLRNYEALSGLQLSELTHRPGTPWSETREKQGVPASGRSSASIPNELIKAHYEQKLGVARPPA